MPGSPADPASSPRNSPRRLGHDAWLLWVTLFAYHAFFLAGAALLVLGVVRSAPLWTYVGLALLLAGVTLQQVDLRWSARLARSGTPFVLGPRDAPVQRRRSAVDGPWLCSGCGWRGERGFGCCPRCGRYLVRLRPELSELPLE